MIFIFQSYLKFSKSYIIQIEQRSDNVIKLEPQQSIIMRSSNLGNVSIAIPTDSRLKSFTEFDDKSVIINEGDQPQLFSNPIFDQYIHLQKWIKCRDRVQKRYISELDNDSTKNSNCYMIQIDDINEIQYKKKNYYKQKQKVPSKIGGSQYINKEQEDSKVYVKVVVNLVNKQKMDYIARTLEFNIVQLQSTKSPSTFKVTDPRLVVFFHSKLSSQSHYKVRIQLSVLQSNVVDLQQVVQHQQYLGFYDLDPFKGLKTKQRGQIYSPKLTVNLQTVILYTILVSDSFKVLQKLIPPNCLCSSEQSIPGLAGRKLPNTMLNTNYALQYTELHSLKVDIACVNIPDSLINNKLKQCEQLLKHFQNVDGATTTLKQVKLEGIYHNGWTSFCQSSIKIQDKMQIQRKNSKKTQGEIIKIKHFTTQELFTLPFVFLDQQALLIFQLSAKVQVKSKSDLSYSQTLSVPLCYAFYVINKISVDQKQVRTLYVGDGINIDSQEFGNKKNESPGHIQFYINLEQANKMQLSKHLITLHSNKSHTEVDRIILEKQRMIRENRKLKQQNRINKIQLNQQIPILDTTNFKQNLYRNQIQRLRQQRREKQQTLQYLKKKIKQLTPSPDESFYNQNISNEMQIHKNFLNRSGEKKFFDSIFYQAALQKSGFINNFPMHNPDAIDVYIHSFFKNKQATNLYQSGQIPLDIIKTQLLQKNYSYGVFINLISLLPATSDKRLPRKFYFQTNFYRNQNLKSCICTINQSTGQIQVYEQSQVKKIQHNEEPLKKFTRNDKRQKTEKKQDKQEQKFKKETKKKMQKIFFIEVKPQIKTKNNQNNFIQFICYLYHSQLQIKIIDSVSGIQFGECFFKLKELIRMRRNQVSVVRDIWLVRSNQAKAKLKIQIKALRKQPTYISQQETISQPISKVQTLSMQPQARQLQRIAMFKKQKEGISTQALTKVQKMLNQQLTKQQIYLKVVRMKGQFIKLQIVNRKNFTQAYRVTINDPDRTFLNNQQLIVVNSVLFNTIKETRWWKFLNSIDPLKYSNLTITDQKNCFQLNPGQTGAILLYYYSERKYQGNYEIDKSIQLYKIQQDKDKAQFGKKNQLNITSQPNPQVNDERHALRIYNHKRCIDLTLSNSSSNYLHSIYKIHVLPEPDFSVIRYKFVRKSNSKILLQIPYNLQKDYVLYIDNPTIVSSLNQSQGYASLQFYTGAEGQSNKFNASILTPFPQNRVLLNYCFQFWGAHEISLQCRLWQMQEVLVDLHSSVCMKKGLQYVLALSEDEKIISIRDKNPIKVNQKQSKTIIRLSSTSTKLGINHYQLNIISPVDYSIVYRYTIKMQTIQPQISEKITLRIKLTDKMLQEPFGFKNQFLRRQKFKILTTHPHILWCPIDIIDVDAKTQKKIKIKINAEEITETEGVILTFIGDKNSLHYLFILELDNQL